MDLFVRVGIPNDPPQPLPRPRKDVGNFVTVWAQSLVFLQTNAARDLSRLVACFSRGVCDMHACPPRLEQCPMLASWSFTSSDCVSICVWTRVGAGNSREQKYPACTTPMHGSNIEGGPCAMRPRQNKGSMRSKAHQSAHQNMFQAVVQHVATFGSLPVPVLPCCHFTHKHI